MLEPHFLLFIWTGLGVQFVGNAWPREDPASKFEGDDFSNIW